MDLLVHHSLHLVLISAQYSIKARSELEGT